MIDNVTKEEEKVLLHKLIKNLINNPSLNSWEKEFLESISKQLVARDLSEKQLKVLNRIRKKCGTPV